ncbi:MAG: peptidylprolyl isomerase [Halothiobacillaceae bacterium]
MKPARVAVLGTAVIGALLLAGCQDEPRQAAPTPHISQSSGQAADDSAVLAMINGVPLTAMEMEVLQERGNSGMDADQLFEQITEIRLLAARAREEGLMNDPRVQARLRHVEDNQLASDYLTAYLEDLELDESRMRALYEEYVSGLPERQEYRAAHILVDEQSEAQALIEQLESGADFGELAREHSKDPGSGTNGGDLGWFSAEQMVPEFSEGVQALEIDQFSSEPVQSDFGWHVILLKDQRDMQPPAFEALRPQLENELRREAIDDRIRDLRENAQIIDKRPQGAPDADG